MNVKKILILNKWEVQAIIEALDYIINDEDAQFPVDEHVFSHIKKPWYEFLKEVCNKLNEAAEYFDIKEIK